MERCKKCGNALSADEIALHKKLCGKGSESFWCLNCLAEYFEVSTELLKEKIKHFREMGCSLFN